MSMKVMDNIQFFVEKVHIRFEDLRSVEGKPFALGFTLDHLHVESANEHWEPSLTSVGEPVKHKVSLFAQLIQRASYNLSPRNMLLLINAQRSFSYKSQLTTDHPTTRLTTYNLQLTTYNELTTHTTHDSRQHNSQLLTTHNSQLLTTHVTPTGCSFLHCL